MAWVEIIKLDHGRYSRLCDGGFLMADVSGDGGCAGRLDPYVLYGDPCRPFLRPRAPVAT